MCRNTIEYKCIALCSLKCKESIKVYPCQKYKTFNNCSNPECNVYVCEECNKKLIENNLIGCIINCENNTNFDKIVNLNQIKYSNCNIKKSCKNFCNNIKDTIVLRSCIKDFVFYLKSKTGFCNNLSFILGFIFIPLFVSIILNILFNGIDSIEEILSSNDISFIISIIILFWLYGFLFCIIVIHIFLRCTNYRTN